MNDEILGTYLDKRWNELQNPNERNKAVYPWKGQLISGVYSENFEKRWNEYLTDDEGEVRTRKRSQSEERDYFNHYKLQKSNASKYEQYI